jgi:intracellular multiplication protein IcmQ
MTIISNTRTELEAYQTRKQLLEQLHAENQQIIVAIEKFYSQNARHEAGALQTLEEVITAFDRLLAAGDWNNSLFLRNAIKPLKNLREQACQLREQLLGHVKSEAIVAPVLAPEMMKVYIAIFQYKAHNSKDWEAQLRSLPQYILGRPIYRDESAVQQALRAKQVQTSDAYVCVGIPEAAIQTGEFHPLQIDKQGNSLLQLVSGSVKSENILEFVYQNGRYYFIDGKLVEKK